MSSCQPQYKNENGALIDIPVNASTLERHPASYFATASELNNHTGNTLNPHNVTSSQVGLGPFETSVSNIKMDGTASVGSSSNVPRADHVHPHDTTKVNKAGDTMTGALSATQITSTSTLIVNGVTITGAQLEKLVALANLISGVPNSNGIIFTAETNAPSFNTTNA